MSGQVESGNKSVCDWRAQLIASPSLRLPSIAVAPSACPSLISLTCTAKPPALSKPSSHPTYALNVSSSFLAKRTVVCSVNDRTLYPGAARIGWMIETAVIT